MLTLHSILAGTDIGSYGFTTDYINEVSGWQRLNTITPDPSLEGKCLPYHRNNGYSWHDYCALVTVGNYLHRYSQVIPDITDRAVRYIVSTGHNYELSARKYPMPTSRRLQATPTRLNRFRGMVDWAYKNAFPGGWQSMQEESVRRYFREGCSFRRVFVNGQETAVRFVEPRHIRGPSPAITWNDELIKIGPYSIRPTDHRLGVVPVPGDVTQPLGYWIHQVQPDSINEEDRENFELVPADEMKHVKQGVDSTDPRGLPIFWRAACHTQNIDNTRRASYALAEVRACYAVIRQYSTGYSFEKLAKVASAHRDKEVEENAGRPIPGKEVDAKGFQYEFPDHNLDADGFEKLIQSAERSLGSVLDMPAWMSSCTAPGGGSSGVAATEGPFDRRVKTEQCLCSPLDIELLWETIANFEGWSKTEVKDWQAVVEITPSYPQVQTRDATKETTRVIAELHAGIESPQGAAGQLRRDYDAVQSQVEEHNKAYPDRKVVGKWDPDTEIQRNKGDNVRPNRQTPKPVKQPTP